MGKFTNVASICTLTAAVLASSGCGAIKQAHIRSQIEKENGMEVFSGQYYPGADLNVSQTTDFRGNSLELYCGGIECGLYSYGSDGRKLVTSFQKPELGKTVLMCATIDGIPLIGEMSVGELDEGGSTKYNLRIVDLGCDLE